METVKLISGKYLDIMIKNRTFDKVNIKDISYRKTVNGSYILYADKSELILVEEDVADAILCNRKSGIKENYDLFEVLQANKFIINEGEITGRLPKEPTKKAFSAIRKLLLFLYLLSVGIIILNSSGELILSGINLTSFKTNIFVLIFTGIAFSICTTILHEFMHVVFSNNISNLKNILSVSIKKSVAFVSLTHVWTWSLLSRLMAVAVGVMSDTIILAIVLILRKFYNNEILLLFSAIMFLRIIWQFRFHRKTDGRYFVMMLLDNPMIDIDYKNNKELLTEKECYIWRVMTAIGITVDIYLLAFWIVPILYKLIMWMGGIV